MKRLQVMLPDAVYAALKREALRRQLTVAEVVRRGIDHQLASSVQVPFRAPALTPVDLGTRLIPFEDWREEAND
jgi:hypothetical protein